MGAKIQYCLGKELEIHTFDKPSVVVAPGGFLHCPSVTLDVTSPIGYSFFIISLGADHSAGETRSADRDVRVGYTAMTAAMEAGEWQTAAKPVGIEIHTATLDDQPQAARGTIDRRGVCGR